MRKLILFMFSHRTLALLRWDIHFLTVRLKNFLLGRSGAIVRKTRNNKGALFLNLGSGPRGLKSEEWINIDGFRDANVHYLCDFSRRLPFDDKSFDGIFCEHVFEHFTYEGGQALMKECRRILKESGVLRIVVPDGNKILKSYFDEPSRIVEYKGVKSGYPMEAVNTWFYQRYEHQCIYDAAYLIDALKKSGFSAALLSAYNTSTAGAERIVLDDPKYSWESLYVEAVK